MTKTFFALCLLMILGVVVAGCTDQGSGGTQSGGAAQSMGRNPADNGQGGAYANQSGQTQPNSASTTTPSTNGG